MIRATLVEYGTMWIVDGLWSLAVELFYVLCIDTFLSLDGIKGNIRLSILAKSILSRKQSSGI